MPQVDEVGANRGSKMLTPIESTSDTTIPEGSLIYWDCFDEDGIATLSGSKSCWFDGEEFQEATIRDFGE
jgi:hypothetical protein